MKIAEVALLVVGVLATFFGLSWMGQGSGIINFPADSFMINQTPWIWRGAIVALVGVIGIWYLRRM